MIFSDEQLNSFIALYKREFGEDIDRAEAQRQASALVSLVKITYKPMTQSEYLKVINLAKSLGYGKI